jgi:hypothetical protein
MVRNDENLEENLKIMGNIILDIEDNQMKLVHKAVTPLMMRNMIAAFHTQIDRLAKKLTQDSVYNL